MHDHHHDHHHHVHHDSSQNIATAFWLNFVFTLIEFVGGVLTSSTAIMADAIHDLGDTLSIGLAWLLQKMSGKKADRRFSYGYRRFSLLGALVNSVILVVGSIWVLTEAIPRLANPTMPHAVGMFWLAVLGVAVNGFAAYRLSKGQTLNERVLNWHLIEDVLGWVAVLLASVVLMVVDWPIIDPILSIGFTIFILVNVIRNLWRTLLVFLQAAPNDQLHHEIEGKLQQLDHIQAIHHLHIWSLDGEKHVLTAHLVLENAIDAQVQRQTKEAVAQTLAKYPFEHTTIELEQPREPCRDGEC